MDKNKPVKEFRDGVVKASIFEREVVNKKKETFISKSVSLQVSYKDKSDEWVNKSLTITKKDLNKVRNVLEKASVELGTSTSSPSLSKEANAELRLREEEAEWRIDK